MSERPLKQVILGAHFPGVNHNTVWSDPASGSQIDFASFTHLARTAERGKFDFFFLAEGLRLREQRGRIHDLDVVGRPDGLGVLSALAGVTTHLGLVGTLNVTFREPYELARQLSTLDLLSEGRSGWNVVTSSDAFTGENFRRGGYLDRDLRYERAREFIAASRRMWDSWAEDEVVADPVSGRFVRRGDAGAFAYSGPQFDVHGRFNVPRSPQGHPVILQAGDSDGGRELAAATADAVFTGHATMTAGLPFYADVKRRLARYGRSADSLKILPASTFALGDTHEDAVAEARRIRFQQITPQTALSLMGQVWNRDLSGYDPDGPLPEVDPDVSSEKIIQGQARRYNDPLEVAARWRALASAKGLSIRELIVETLAAQTFIGTPLEVAHQINDTVQADATDGFILVPTLTPGGLDRFVEEVVPHLQELGVFRTEYTTTTLRDHLGLGAARSWDVPVAPAAEPPVPVR